MTAIEAMRTIKVIKIGGNVVNNPEALDSFLEKFTSISGPKILVHGGGKEATALSKALGIETKMVNGRRVTDKDTLDVVTMVYAGLINKRIVAHLQALGCDAIGLSGADADVIAATRRPANPIDFGYVGDIAAENVSEHVISMFLSQSITPVFCAITHDRKGGLLNCNADSIASNVAVASARIMPTTLTFCFEKPGVLADAEDDSTVIPAINHKNVGALTSDGTLSGGMLPKIENALAAIDAGVKCVTIKSAEDLLDTAAGTKITIE